jgi:isoquinoline 1-oxidoreductase subunit beta
MRHGYYRPYVAARMRADLDGDGRPTRWMSRFTGGRFDGGAARPPYPDIERDIEPAGNPSHLRTGSWRSVAASQHGFFTESLRRTSSHTPPGRDRVEYRADLLRNAPRHRAVLMRAAEMAEWRTPAPEGRARGVAIVESFGTVVAEVAEVGLTETGRIRVYRVDVAVDCGLVVHPDQAEAQIAGGVVFGLSAALFHEITVRDGVVEQGNFPAYPMLTLADTPVIRVEFLASEAPIGGLGEPGVPPIAPAVANAVQALTGRRLRSLPLRLG